MTFMVFSFDWYFEQEEEIEQKAVTWIWTLEALKNSDFVYW